jgi:hypothetical protein
VYEDASQCADILSLDLRQKPVNLRGESTRYDPSIQFSGFSSQGDGASFNGYYAYKRGCARAMQRYAPQDTVLHRIAADLVALQKKYDYRLAARCTQSGRYCQSDCMHVSVSYRGGYDAPNSAKEKLTDIMRAFADWIYRQLEQEQEYLLADAQVDESIRANNEYDFDEEGDPST